MQSPGQTQLFAESSLLDRDEAQKALDELFHEAGAYRSSENYLELLKFVRKFPSLAPFNAFLLHVQKPGTQYVASVRQWKQRFNRSIKPGARPLVVMIPFGPVGFVYDLPDTEGPDPFPDEMLAPFKTKGQVAPATFNQTVSNLIRDRVYFAEADHSTSQAGCIKPAAAGRVIRTGGAAVAALYELLVNKNLDMGARYATLIHELAHLYCGHLGTPDETWWPDRQKRTKNEREFEAESVTWLICERMGLENPSAEYLSGYLEQNQSVPTISLDAVLKAVGYIEAMGRRHLGERRKHEAGERANRGVRRE